MAAAGAAGGAIGGGVAGGTGGAALCSPGGPVAAGCAVAGAIEGAKDGAIVGGLVGAAVGDTIDKGIALYNKIKGDNTGGHKSPTSGSGKEKATDIPSWVRQNGANRPLVGETPNETAVRVMNGKYGEGNWTRATGEFSKIQKWAARSFK